MLVLIGDGSQSIYSFRGAQPEVFCSAERFLDADITTHYLPNNYRSLPGIVDVGNAVGAELGEEWTAGLVARSKRQGAARIVPLYGDDPLLAAYAAVDTIRASGRPPSDFAILIRTNDMAAVYEGALMARGVPCVRWGGEPFWTRRDVLVFVAYTLLATVGDPNAPGITDAWMVVDQGAFRKVVNQPKRYLSRAWTDNVCARVMDGQDLVSAIKSERNGLGSKQLAAARELASFIARLRSIPWHRQLAAIEKLMVDDQESRSKGKDTLAVNPEEERKSIPMVCASIARKERIQPGGGQPARPFINGYEFALYADAAAKRAEESQDDNSNADRVTISTIHRFKGLERPCVMVPIGGGLFPHRKSASTAKGRAEELRLLYVAYTRARDELYVLVAAHTHKGDKADPPVYTEYLGADIHTAVAARVEAMQTQAREAAWGKVGGEGR